jgi:carboxyl-terminal processing protease
MKKKIFLTFVGLFILSVIIGGDARVSQARRQEESIYRNIELFIDVVEIVKDQYIESVEDKELIYGALKGMLLSLDPYSAFLEPEMKKELQIETKGEFHGVGMEITLKEGILTVVSPIEETPAWNAGIKAGDKIIEIDGESTKGLSTFEAAQKLRGKKGTEVTISILRTGLSELKKITLVRDVIKVKSIKTKVLDNGAAYVRVRDFQERTAADLAKVLEDLNINRIQGLVLDLRNNPGGLLTSAIDVSELFLPKGKLIVYTQGREKKDRSTFNSRKNPVWSKPVVLLFNQGSASASEIVIGALKDNIKEIATVGMKTFGKGSVQNLIPLKDGSALKLTIAHYYTPSGICIEGKGIEPDVEVELPEDKSVIPGETDDLQFQKAVEILRQRLNEQISKAGK